MPAEPRRTVSIEAHGFEQEHEPRTRTITSFATRTYWAGAGYEPQRIAVSHGDRNQSQKFAKGEKTTNGSAAVQTVAADNGGLKESDELMAAVDGDTLLVQGGIPIEQARERFLNRWRSQVVSWDSIDIL